MKETDNRTGAVAGAFIGDDFPTGKLRYTMRNDYMFKAVLQKNKRALKGLLSALLYMKAEDITEIQILNPIELGERVDGKKCILDLKLMLNNSSVLNIELQVAYFKDWVERSLTYLCRLFNHLHEGQEYGEVMATYHIGILDFWLPGKTKEFYSEYRLMNVKNHEIYSSKFGIRVVNLKAVDEEDIVKEPEELYEWAKLFKASTWEELKMLAEKNDYIADTVVTLRELTDDEKIRMQCEARERYELDRLSYIAQGREEERGEFEKRLIMKICRKLIKGKSLEEIADDLEEDVGDIEHIYNAALKYAPDYDADKIYDEIYADA